MFSSSEGEKDLSNASLDVLEVDESTTFKDILMDLVMNECLGVCEDFEVEKTHYALSLRFVDPIQLQRMDYFPHPNVHVLGEIRRQEVKWGISGEVAVVLESSYRLLNDSRDSCDADDITFGRKGVGFGLGKPNPRTAWDHHSWDDRKVVYEPFCVEGASTAHTHTRHSAGGLQQIPASLGSFINNSLIASAVKHGTMLMYEHLADSWVEVYVVLNDEQLCYFAIAQPQNPASTITLSSNKVHVEISVESPYIFHLHAASKDHTKLVSDSPHAEFAFKCPHKHIAEEWVHTIKKRNLARNSDDIIALLEASIEKEEFDHFIDVDVQTIAELMHFEGMISNHTLRPLFQKFLADEYKEENFKFWEYAEDYRRGHPKAKNPFDFVSTTDGKAINSKQQVRHWGGLLFGAFLEDRAPQQVGECSSEERIAIKEAVLQEPADNIFGKVQSACFRLLKFTEYPGFVLNPAYQRHLRMSYLPYAHDARPFRGPGPRPKEIKKWPMGEGETTGQVSSLPCPWRKGQLRSGSSAPGSRNVESVGAFEPWMGNDWWNQVDMTEWKSFATNASHEEGLKKMLPQWMPLDMDDLCRDMKMKRDERIAMSHALYEMNDVGLRAKGLIPEPSDPECLSLSETSYLNGTGESYLHRPSEVGGRFDLGFLRAQDNEFVAEIVHPVRLSEDDVEVEPDAVEEGGEDEYSIGSRNSSRLTLGSSDGNKLKKLMVLRRRVQDPLVCEGWGIQGTFILASAMRTVGIKREVKLQSMVRRGSVFGGDSPEKEARKQDDDFEASFPHGATSEALRRLVVLTNYRGEGRLYIMDLKKPNNTAFMVCLTKLNGPKVSSAGSLRTFELPLASTETENVSLEFEPEGVGHSDSLRLCTEWIRHLHAYCGPGAVGLLKYGGLEKQGLVNKQFRRRLFTLATDGTMAYYKPDTTAKQGHIDLHGLKALEWLKEVEGKKGLFGMAGKAMKGGEMTKFQLTDHQDRKWVLASKHQDDAILWGNKIYRVAFGDDHDNKSDDDIAKELQLAENTRSNSLKSVHHMSLQPINEDDKEDAISPLTIDGGSPGSPNPVSDGGACGPKSGGKVRRPRPVSFTLA